MSHRKSYAAPRQRLGGAAYPTASLVNAPVPDGFAAAVLDAIPDPTAVLDMHGVIVAVNHAWRMFSLDNGGDPAATGVGVSYVNVCLKSAERGCTDAGPVVTQIRAVLAGETVEAEVEYACPSPAVRRWFMLRVAPLAGPAPGAIVSHVNITRRKMAEKELAHAASHDPLSGLANRTLFNDQLSAALGGVGGRRAGAGGVGLLYIDLDGFKAVNDTYGHSAGDEVLLTVVHRLRRTVRPGDVIARLGGDEFAVLATRIDSSALAGLAARVDTVLSEPHHVHGQIVHTPGSIGTHIATPGEDAKLALDQADKHMYRNKAQRKLMA